MLSSQFINSPKSAVDVDLLARTSRAADLLGGDPVEVVGSDRFSWLDGADGVPFWRWPGVFVEGVKRFIPASVDRAAAAPPASRQHGDPGLVGHNASKSGVEAGGLALGAEPPPRQCLWCHALCMLWRAALCLSLGANARGGQVEI